MLSDEELARIIRAARQVESPYGSIVELLALTGQRREEVARLTWNELDSSTSLQTFLRLRPETESAVT